MGDPSLEGLSATLESIAKTVDDGRKETNQALGEIRRDMVTEKMFKMSTDSTDRRISELAKAQRDAEIAAAKVHSDLSNAIITAMKDAALEREKLEARMNAKVKEVSEAQKTSEGKMQGIGEKVESQKWDLVKSVLVAILAAALAFGGSVALYIIRGDGS